MKARLPEAAGGKPAMPVSGALGAALLAAALLLAPGEARALIECGPSGANVLTCSGATYNDGIYYPESAKLAGTNPTVSVPGRSAGSTTITLGSQAAGIHVESQATHGFTVNVGGSTGGTAHVVNIVQGTNSVSGANRNNGVYLRQIANNRTTTLDVRSGVTIGSSATPMKQNGIFVDLRPTAASQGVGATAGTITSAATIHAAGQGIRVGRTVGGTNDATTVTNTGAIHSGVGNAAATGTYVDRPHGIHVLHGGTQRTGSLTVTNSGDITVGGAYTGILMNYWGAGALSLDNSGDIAAATGQTAKQGIQFNYKYWDNQSAQAITLTNSGAITAAEFGIRLTKVSGGAVELTNSGAVTATADAAQHTGHAIYLAEGVTFGSGRTYATNSGTLTVDNRGALSSKNHALYVFTATADDDIELTNSGAVASEDGDGIRIERRVEGDITFANGGTSTTSGNVSGRWHGVYVGKAARIDFDQTAGTISGRTGVYLEVTRESAMGDARSVDGDGNHVPAIDVAWTGGNVARGTATDDQGRFRAATAAQVLAFDRESAAVKAVEGTLHYGGAAGIEAHALSWRDVAAQVAKGDDPGAVADNAAQMNLLSTTHADSRRAAILAQFRAALGNDEIAVAAPILTAIGTTATTAVSELTDTQIVTYLSTNNGATRTLLRNVLAQGLSDDEKAILRAVATNDGVDDALTAAGFTDDAANDSDYWSLVKALLDRRNLDDIRVSMTAGSIDSRGDGIRAYYATPHDDNGAISVAIAAGATVEGGMAGIYAANAGATGTGADRILKQTVTVHGTVTGGAGAAVHLAGGGRLTVGATGKVRAGSSGLAILAGGRAVVRVDGEVRGGRGGGAEATPAVHLAGAGSELTVGPAGRVALDNGAELAIRRDGERTELIVLQDPGLALDGGGFTQPGVEDAIERLGGAVGGEGGGEIRVAMGEPDDPDTPSGAYFPVTLDEIALKPASEISVASGEIVETENVPAIEAVSRDAVDIAIDVAAGARVRSTGHHGIHAYYPTSDDDNGAIRVTVAAGATVTGGMAGIHVENAGLGAGEDETAGTDDDILKQTVTVHGTVTGGTDAAVHLAGGGRLTVGERGLLIAGSGQPAILVNDPGRAEIRIDGEVRGSAGAGAAVHLTGGGRVVVGPKGRVNPNGATVAILREGDRTVLIAIQDPDLAAEGGGFTPASRKDAIERLGGTVGGEGGGEIRVAMGEPSDPDLNSGMYFPVIVDGNSLESGPGREEPGPGRERELEPDREPERLMGRMDCAMAGIPDKCRLYEALPAALLAMNGLPTYGERMAAARDAAGGWARIDGADGEWRAKNATQPNMAFDYRRYGVQAGVDFAVGGDGRFGVSVRGLQGSAEMAGSGAEIDLSGVGAGAHGTAFLGGGFHVDAQAMATWYDVELTSGRTVLTDNAKGLGLALGVEVGRRTDMGGGLTVTPGAGLSWSEVDLSFARSANERVSVEDARSLVGRAGLRVEMEAGFRLFGSVEATHEFSDRRSARIWGAHLASDVALSATETEKTGFRIGAGGAHGWGDGRYALRASAGYAARGIDNGEFDGGISLAMRF